MLPFSVFLPMNNSLSEAVINGSTRMGGVLCNETYGDDVIHLGQDAERLRERSGRPTPVGCSDSTWHTNSIAHNDHVWVELGDL